MTKDLTGLHGMSMHSRPSWDDIWSQVAAVVSQRSLCSRAQVGAVIVDSANRICTTGYNGPPRGFNHGSKPCTWWCPREKEGSNTFHCVSLHAEANAILAGDKSTWHGGSMYVLGDICIDCAKLIANSGLSTAVVTPDGEDRSYRNPERSYAFLEQCGIDVVIRD